MYIYVIFLGLALLFSLPVSSQKDAVALSRSKQPFQTRTLLLFFCLFLLFALRHPSMGNDLHYGSGNGYLGSFSLISSFSWKKVFLIEKFMNYEKGYILFNKLVSIFSKNQQFFLAVVAFLGLYPIYQLFKKNSALPMLSYVIYFGLPVFLMMFSGLRQVLAMGICLAAFTYVRQKKPIKFVALVLLATFFHSSAFVFLVVYPLYYLKMNKKRRVISLFVLAVIYLLKAPLFKVLSVLFKDSVQVQETGALTLLIVFVLIYIFCTIFSSQDQELNGYMNLFYMACVAQCFAGVHELAMRVGYYFMMFLPLLLPKLIAEMSNKTDRKIVTAGVFVCFGLYGLYSLSTSFWADAVPYYFFWQKI